MTTTYQYNEQWPCGSVKEARLEVLHLMKGLLENDNERYMCYALDRIRLDHQHLSWACDDLQRMIKREIKGNNSMQTYIADELFKGQRGGWVEFTDPYKQDYYYNRGVMQLARLAWIDKLIENESASA